MAWLDRFQLLENSRDSRSEILDAIPESDEGDHGYADSLDILLKLDARIVGDEHFESCVDCSSEQHAIPKSEPTLRANGGCLMPRKLCSEVTRKTLINENSHPR